MAKRSNKKASAPTLTFEVFGAPSDSYWPSPCRRANDPYCFNGTVSVRRWRYTAELVDEPIEEIRDRILKLWLESDNFHEHGPIREEAKKYGLELDGNLFGIARSKRKEGK